MKTLYHTLFLNTRFFYYLLVIALFFVLGFFQPLFFNIAQVLLFVLGGLLIIDIYILFKIKNGILLKRFLPERLSNGEVNEVSLELTSMYRFPVNVTVIEELPPQFQKRNFAFTRVLKHLKSKHLKYQLKPFSRGIYDFGHSNVYSTSPLKLASRKYVLGQPTQLKAYPSFLNLRSFDIKGVTSNVFGTKKTRRIGHSLEFEQIKDYVTGDDIRMLNWKATAKRNQLMINQFIEEKSQSVYSIIDKGRVMEMNFNGLTLLDYAINATLAVSHVVLRKQDKLGMLTFSKDLEDWVVAERRNSQMHLISESLYNIKTDFSESDFSKLYAVVKRKITHRRLLLLYTNFETMDGLKRQLPYLRALAKNHLLVIIFFKNTELNTMITKGVRNVQEAYDTIIAEQFMFEKKQIVNELKKLGIQAVLTKPENLTGETITKYLELKARGLF